MNVQRMRVEFFTGLGKNATETYETITRWRGHGFHDPEIKFRFTRWKTKCSPLPKKTDGSDDSWRRRCYEIVPKGQKANQVIYKENRLRRKIYREHCGKRRANFCTSIATREFSVKMEIAEAKPPCPARFDFLSVTGTTPKTRWDIDEIKCGRYIEGAVPKYFSKIERFVGRGALDFGGSIPKATITSNDIQLFNYRNFTNRPTHVFVVPMNLHWMSPYFFSALSVIRAMFPLTTTQSSSLAQANGGPFFTKLIITGSNGSRIGCWHAK